MSGARSTWCRRSVAVVVTLLTVAACAGDPAPHRSVAPASVFSYDAAGRLAGVRDGDTTAVLRYDAAGDRVGVDHVRSGDVAPAARRRILPRINGVAPGLVAQGSTVTISGTGFDPSPTGDVVAVGGTGGALARVLSASPTELRVELPPVAQPGPVTVSTAHGRATSHDDLVVTPAEVAPSSVGGRVELAPGHSVSVPTPEAAGRRTLLTVRGVGGTTVELHLRSDGRDVCGEAEVGLAGPTGTIVEATAGGESWCARPARLPMTGTYTATLAAAGDVRATVTASAAAPAAPGAPPAPDASTVPQAWDEPPHDGPDDFPVDLSSGSLGTQVTDLDLGGSGAADLTRSLSVDDPDLPSVAPEEPLARQWSLGASFALVPSSSYTYLDAVLPDGLRLPYRRVTPGAPEPTGAVFEPASGLASGPLAGSRVSYTGSGWELRTRTGTVLGFARTGSPLRLAWIRDAAGRTARFVRAPDDDGSLDGELVGVVSEDGQWARFTHDSQHRIVGATDQVGDEVRYRYGRPAGVPADLLVGASYRPAGGGSTTTVGYRYQAFTGRLLAVTDGRRDVLRLGYDDAGRVVRESVLGAPGVGAGEWRFSYVVGTRRVTIPGRAGGVSVPQVTRAVVTGPAGRRTVTFAAGRWVSDTSSAGTLRAVRRPGGVLTSIRRTGGGQAPTGVRFGYSQESSAPTSVETAAGTRTVAALPETGSALDTAGGLPEGYLPVPGDGGAAVLVDAKGRRAATRDADGAVTRIGYDGYDRPVSVTDPDGSSTRFTYTAAGDLASVTDPGGTTRYGWNVHGQQVSETDALGGRQEWRHDAAGRLVWSRSADGIVSTFGYDRLERLVVARYGVGPDRPAAARVDYVYDRLGRVATIRDSTADGPISFRYDDAGHVVEEATASGTVRRGYDAAGRRTDLTLPGDVSVRSSYSAQGRLDGLRLRDRSADVDVGVAARYDGHGRLAGLDLPGGVRGRLDYSDGQLTGLAYSRAGRPLATQHASYDTAGRLRAVSGDLGRPTLPRASSSTYDAAHQLTVHDGHVWRWDRAGQLLQDDRRQYTWDVRGRLVAVSGPGGRTTYGYDALGRRTTSTTAGRTTRFVYDGDDVVEQVGPDGRRTSYLRGPDGTPLAGTDGAAATAYLSDVLGNTAATVAPDGTVRRSALDPFGETVSQPEGQPGFRGLVADPSGLVFMGARVYDPNTGRFLSRDSWGIEGGDTDPYRYALGAPTVYTDPSGHVSECVGIALGWAMSVLGPGGGWDDYDALEDKAQAGAISQDEWTVRADRVSHDIWSGFDVVANVCGTSAVGTSAAALPLLGSRKLAASVLGGLADDAVTGAASTRVGPGLGRLQPGVSARARQTLDRLLRSHEATLTGAAVDHGLISSRSLKFTQDSASATFRDGRSILDLADDMVTLGRAPDGMPAVQIFREGDSLYSLDNRRLFAGQYADVDLPYRWATRGEIAGRRRSEIFDGTSISIRLPGGRGNWGWWQQP